MKWSGHELKWQIYFSSLKYCKQIYGHLNVPKEWSSKNRHVNFDSWLSQQRVAKKRRLLDKEKIELLDQIGFSWEKEAHTPDEAAAK